MLWSFFPCISDDIALTNILTGLLQLSMRNVETEKDEKLLLVDFYVKYWSCSTICTEVNAASHSVTSAQLHTLHHGSIKVDVAEIICLACGKQIPYDGLCNSLFRLNKGYIFTRELIDSWVWELCRTGGTFRDSFFSWDSRCVTPSTKIHVIGSTSRSESAERE